MEISKNMKSQNRKEMMIKKPTEINQNPLKIIKRLMGIILKLNNFCHMCQNNQK